MYRLVFAVPFLVVGFFGCASKAPTESKSVAYLPTVVLGRCFLREELLVPGGLREPGTGMILAYARPSLAAKAERLCGKMVYLKYTLGKCVLRDIEERSLLDEIVKKMGDHRGLFPSLAGWGHHRWCTDVRLDFQKKLLTFRTGDEERAVLFFGERIPDGKVFHITTVTACMDVCQAGRVIGDICLDAVVRVEAVE